MGQNMPKPEVRLPGNITPVKGFGGPNTPEHGARNTPTNAASSSSNYSNNNNNASPANNILGGNNKASVRLAGPVTGAGGFTSSPAITPKGRDDSDAGFDGE